MANIQEFLNFIPQGEYSNSITLNLVDTERIFKILKGRKENFDDDHIIGNTTLYSLRRIFKNF